MRPCDYRGMNVSLLHKTKTSVLVGRIYVCVILKQSLVCIYLVVNINYYLPVICEVLHYSRIVQIELDIVR